ncbi:MAG: hypothetical protein ACRC37_04110, partial [Lentisphaeria bacterium]
MELEIKNIGIIHHAKIKFNGLTIIAGENDTGKSFVGKTIFAIVKAFNNFNNNLPQSKLEIISQIIEQFNSDFKDIPNLSQPFLAQFLPNLFINECQLILKNPSELLEPIFNKKYQLIANSIPNNQIVAFNKKLKLIENIILKPLSIQDYLSHSIFSEFNCDINSAHSKLYLSENQLNIFDASILSHKNVKINSIDAKLLQKPFIFHDATLIETPIVLQLYHIIQLCYNNLDQNNSPHIPLHHNIPLHIKDLILKLKATKNSSTKITDSVQQLISYIENIIQGEICFDHSLNEFKYLKNLPLGNCKTLKTHNTANGIQSFGIINLLLKLNILNQNS